jgi:hypothetical protein
MENKPTDTAVQEQQSVAPHNHHTLTIAAFILTVLAWVTIPFQNIVSMCFAVIALALAIIGIRQPRGGSRNLAVVSLVAAAVLLLVYAIFWIALLYITVSF